jgi:alpha-D-xyloside xylohydrolase
MPLWAADLGGYLGVADTPNQRLLERWTEYSAFSPVMEVMSSKNISPWNFDANGPAGSHEALDIYKKYSILHMSLFPYRYAAAQEAAKTGMPILRALVLNWQDDAVARGTKDEYLFGPDFLVAPVIDEGLQRPVYLPPGAWVNYWTGEQVAGGKVVVADAPIDSIPVWARAGAVIAKIPEDVMTLVPQSESGNTTVKSLDDRRVYELIGGGDARLTDFEGRTVVRTGDSLRITGDSAARMIVRWRFGSVASATVNGAPATVESGPDGPYVEFDHANASQVTWQEGPPPAPASPPQVAPPPTAAPGVPVPPVPPPATAVRPVPVGRVVPAPAGGTTAPAATPAAKPAAQAPAAPEARPAAPAAKHRTTHHRRRRSRKKSSSAGKTTE